MLRYHSQLNMQTICKWFVVIIIIKKKKIGSTSEVSLGKDYLFNWAIWNEESFREIWLKAAELCFQFCLVTLVVRKWHNLALNREIRLHSVCSSFTFSLSASSPHPGVFISTRALTGLSTAAVIRVTLCIIAPRWVCNDILTHALMYTCTQLL